MQTGDIRQAVRLLLETSLAEGSVMRRGCLAVNTATEATIGDPEAIGVVEEHFARSRSILAGLLKRGRTDGTICLHHSLEALTASVFNAWVGLRVSVRAGASLDLLSADVSAVLSLLD
ncbi:hypothetical protein ABZV80_44660 [Streptomyces sp. NPDC005132]|uniref:hypothetical protein n=1 Tax=Streptomyces sp. NPDC005132 TaxID=3154294 RepID=UPI0033A73F4D